MPFQPFFSEPQTIDVRQPAGGLVDAGNIDLLSNEQASVSLNAHYDRFAITKRLGRVQLGDTIITDVVARLLYHYRNRDGSVKEVLRVSDNGAGGTGKLYRLDGVNWEGFASGTNPGTSADVVTAGGILVSVVQWADDLYFGDGGATKKMLRDGVAIETWGHSGPTTLSAGTNGSNTNGSLTVGDDYKWVYTLYNPTLGTETNPSTESAVFTAAADPNDGKNITVPAIGVGNWDTRFTKIRIYRVRGDGATFFFEKEITIAGDFETVAQTTTLTVSDSALGSQVEFDNFPPPPLRYLTLYNKRVFGVDPSNPSQLRWSKESNPNAWPPVNAEDIERDAGDPITGLFVLLGSLYVLKRNAGVFQVAPTESTFIVQKLTGDFGCFSHFSILVIETWAYWLDTKGAVRFNGQQVENLSDPRIRRLYGLLTGVEPNIAYGVHDRQPDKHYARWILIEPTTGTLRLHLICDLSKQIWTEETSFAGDDVGAHDRVACVMQAGGNWVLTSDNRGHVFRLRTDISGNPVYSDVGQPIGFSWASKWFGDGRDVFLPLYLDFEIERSALGKTNGDVLVTWGFDGDEGDFAPLELPFRGERQTFRLRDVNTLPGQSFSQRIHLGRRPCRRIRFRLRHAYADGDLSILSFRLIWKPVGSRMAGR